MRRSTNNFFDIFGFTKHEKRSRSLGRRGASSSNPLNLAVEQLENRRMLTTPAVGSFLRLEGIPGPDKDISSFISATAAANTAYDPATGPNYEDMEDNNLVRSAISRYASDAGATASSFVKAAGFILPAIDESIGWVESIAVPFVSIESVQLGAATQGSGGAEAFSSPSAGLRGKFEYQDPTPLVTKEFYGAIYIPAIGVGVASGESSSWGTSQIPSGSIKKNGVTVASVSVFGSGGSGLGKPGSIEYTVSVWVEGQDPYQFQTSGVNVYVNFVTSIEDGDEFTFDASVGVSSGSSHTSAQNVSEGSSLATLNFVQTVAVYGFAYETGNPPTLPPVWDGDGEDLPMFHYDTVPGDLDGDGGVDGDDAIAWANIIDAAAENSNLPLIVTTSEDVNDGDYSFHDLSLREAIALAADSNHPGQDAIVFAKWVDNIDLGGTQLVVNSNVHIAGPGADKLTIDANGLSRVFSINSGVQTTISGLTITDGQVTGTNYGGAIRNAGDLTLNSVVVSDNHSAINGGAVYNAVGSKLRVEDSTFTLNSATTGGAIYSASYLNDAFVIERSAFFDNEANNAGALYLSGDDGLTGTATIRNSTFSGNRALTTSGGAIKNGASAPPLTIINSTIAYNTSVSGGGGIDMHNNSDNRFTLHNTILAHNDATSATTDNLNRAVSSASSYNVIGYGGTSGLTNNVAGNILLGSGVSAGLASLGDYGGKTKTHALLVSSPALDMGNDSLATTYDQRGIGYARIIDGDGVGGARIDIGAYEYDPAASLAFAAPSSQTSRESYFESLDFDLRMEAAMAALFQAEQETTAGRSFWPGHRRMRSRG
jgi:predicted outer membrane repeat protein